MEQQLNPYRPEIVIRLADSVPRLWRANLNAMAIAAAILEADLATAIARLATPEGMAAWLYAGLVEDARQRGEEWNLERAKSLCSITDLNPLAQTLLKIIDRAIAGPPGASQPTHPESADAEVKPWDFATALRLAVRLLGLTPDQFWRLSVWEYDQMIVGASEGQEGEYRFRAQMTANIMSCWMKRRLTADDLLARKSKRRRGDGQSFAEMDQAQKDAALNRVMQKIAGQGKAKDANAGEAETTPNERAKPNAKR